MRYPYSAIPHRGPLKWPDGAHVALMLTLNMEYWDMIKDTTEPYYAGGPPILPDLLPGNVADFPNFMWREYGQRVGIWRQMEVFDEAGVPACVTINAKTALERPEMVDAAKDRGWEILAHNYEQGELLVKFAHDPDGERELVERTLKIYNEAVGKPAKAWLSSSLRGTPNTPGILADNGVIAYCDMMNDDQPYMVETDYGPIVSTPYSNEINDFTIITRRGHTTDEFRDILKEELTELHREAVASGSGRMMNVGLHPHVSGRAYRVRALREFLEYAKGLGGVWFATREQIASWYMENNAGHIG